MAWQAYVLFALTGVVAGFLSGLLSIGGAFVMIPAFLAIFQGYFHFEDKFLLQLTLGTAMACIVVNSSCTALAHNQQSSVSWPLLAAHWPMICMGTAIGVVFTGYLDAKLIKACFGLYCLYSGFRMVTRITVHALAHPPGASKRVVFLFGVVCGLTGTGGANMFVPYLVRSTGLELRKAMGTASAIQIPVSVMGTIVFLLTGLLAPEPASGIRDIGAAGFIFVPGLVLTAVAMPYFNRRGVKLAHRLPASRLKLFFGAFTLMVGVRMMHAALVN